MTKRKIVLFSIMLILCIQIADFAQGKEKPDPIAALQNQINDLQQQINNLWSPLSVHGIINGAGNNAGRGYSVSKQGE